MGKFIERLDAKNFGPFKKLSAQFGPGMNVIIGNNASGKSSLLRIIAASLSNDYSSLRLWRESSFSCRVNINGSRHLVGLGTGAVRQEKPRYRQTAIQQWAYPSPEPTDGKLNVFTPAHMPNQTQFDFAPLVIGPHRALEYQPIQGMTRENPREQRIQQYRSQALRSLDVAKLPSVKQWMINRYFQIDKPWAEGFRNNWTVLMDFLPKIAPHYDGFAFVGIKEDLEPLFQIAGDNIYLEELSSGFKSILSIMFSIVDWIEGVNEGDDRKIQNATGSVLIDELDAHLHPAWQLSVLESMRALFPKLQFIITTHSPHIVASCKENELIVIPQHSGSLELKPEPQRYSGWETQIILERLMSVTSLENQEFRDAYSEAKDAAEACNREMYNNAVQKLQKLVPPGDMIFQLLDSQMAIARAKRISDDSEK